MLHNFFMKEKGNNASALKTFSSPFFFMISITDFYYLHFNILCKIRNEIHFIIFIILFYENFSLLFRVTFFENFHEYLKRWLLLVF